MDFILQYYTPELALILFGLLLAGAASGVLAGIFGIGGGVVLVPMFYELFRLYGVPDQVVMPLSVGTSLAVIVPTSISSFKSHFKRGLVDAGVLKTWILPVLAGVIAGSVVAKYAPGDLFKLVYIGVAALSASYLLYFKNHWSHKSVMPGYSVMNIAGFNIGFFSVLMGIGGGLLSSMFMTYHGRTIHQAISTSSGLGVLISIPGVIGYILAGWGVSDVYPGAELLNLPLAAGYVSLIGFILVAPVSMLTAPLGVFIAHRLSRDTLEKLFGSFLLLIIIRFILSFQIA